MPITVGSLSASAGLVAHLTGWWVLYTVYARGRSCTSVDNVAYGACWVALTAPVVIMTPALSFWLGRRLRVSAWSSLASALVLLALLAIPFYFVELLVLKPVCWD